MRETAREVAIHLRNKDGRDEDGLREKDATRNNCRCDERARLRGSTLWTMLNRIRSFLRRPASERFFLIKGLICRRSYEWTKGLNAPSTTCRVTLGSTTVYAEAADTPAKVEIGLMNLTYLNEDAGMLFIFPTPQQQSFWMKNMRIPLDIVFITADNHVLEIYASVPPCTGDPCTLYTSSAPIQYALEVNSGFCARNGIESGDPVVIAAGS